MELMVEIDGRTYQVTIEDIHTQPVVAKVDGREFEVWPEESPAPAAVPAGAASLDLAEPQAEAAPKPVTGPTGGGKTLTAPLPGVILAVLVKPGERITRGQEVCTLEAMKMKNAIKSHRDGTVGAVKVSVGDQVAHGQTLMTFQE